MNINYEYYHIFYYVAKYKNLTQAAEALQNNQPNISRTIKLLEHTLGCSLLVRSNRGITLTPEGEQLYAHVKIAVEQIETAEEKLMLSTELREGIVTIGASETALHLLLLPVLNQFKQKYPEIRIRIVNPLTVEAIESAKNGLVDFAIVSSPADIDKPLLALPVMEFKDILIGGPSYSFLQDTSVSIQELEQYPLVCLGENTVTYRFYDSFYRSNNVPLKPELEAATADQILAMVKNDLGIGFIPEIYAADALAKREVCRIPLCEKLPTRQLLFVENRNHPLSIAAGELKKLLMRHSSTAYPLSSG